MKVLAFLQNQWFHEPEKVKASIERYGEKYRRRIIHYALFAGCTTGRRLKQAFGEGLCHEVICWEEASKIISGNASEFLAPDSEHIMARIAEEQPDVILAFGKANRELLPTLLSKSDFSHIPIIQAPHPAARHSFVMDELRKAAKELCAFIASKKMEVLR